MSQPPFPTITTNPPYSPGSPQPVLSVDPQEDSQAETAYKPTRQYLRSCHRCDNRGLICAVNTKATAKVARCEACRWAQEKCQVKVNGKLFTVGSEERPTNSKKWVYVDQEQKHISEWPFYHTEVTPSLTDVNFHPTFCKFFSCCFNFFNFLQVTMRPRNQ